jgi:hypothetical protein
MILNNRLISAIGGGGMVFNTTFNNISIISWWSVLLVEEIRVPEENQPASNTPHLSGIQTHNVSGDRH